MEYLGSVNAEGGPLICIDGPLVPQWTGISGADYDRGCALFDADPLLEGAEIGVGNGNAVLWAMGGAGTAAVFRITEEHFVIIRAWPIDPLDLNIARLIAIEPLSNEKEVGNLSVGSGILTVMWAVEDGACIELPASLASGRLNGEASIEDSGLVFEVKYKIFRCLHDTVDTAGGNGRRLHLVSNI
jgi:hypothetical protein